MVAKAVGEAERSSQGGMTGSSLDRAVDKAAVALFDCRRSCCVCQFGSVAECSTSTRQLGVDEVRQLLMTRRECNGKLSRRTVGDARLQLDTHQNGPCAKPL